MASTLLLAAGVPQHPGVPGSTRPDPPVTGTGRVVVVAIGNQMPFYSPPEIVAHVGDKIVWRNAGASDTHAVVSVTGGFSSSDIAAGGEWETVIARPGEATYVCRYHPWMRGTITATWSSAEFVERSIDDARRAGLDPKASSRGVLPPAKATAVVSEFLRSRDPSTELPPGAVIAATVESRGGDRWWLDRTRRKLATFRNGWIVEHGIDVELGDAPSLVAGSNRVWFSSSDGFLNYLEAGRLGRLVLPEHLREARLAGDRDENVWALMGGSAWLLKQSQSR